MDALQRVSILGKANRKEFLRSPLFALQILYLPENNTHSHRFRGDRSYTIIFHHLPRP